MDTRPFLASLLLLFSDLSFLSLVIMPNASEPGDILSCADNDMEEILLSVKSDRPAIKFSIAMYRSFMIIPICIVI